MRFSLLFPALLVQLRATLSSATALPEALNDARVVKRGCNQDNVLRALEAHSSDASAFCTSYNQISSSTIYTVTPTTGVAPVVSTFTQTRTVSFYPNGKHLESIAPPSYVSTYPASRISSACSCLPATTPTETRTASASTEYQYTYTTSTLTLYSACATATPYIGAHAISAGIFSISHGIDNAFECCEFCLYDLLSQCVAWYSTPGDCQAYYSQGCYAGTRYNYTVSESAQKYPDALGGPGACAGSVMTVQG